jgi:two-component system chemotaxis response regulator CheB
MNQLHDGGAKAIAQIEESCVVFRMPKESVKLQAVDSILTLKEIEQAVQRFD